jgi:tetratricopeptide (TPR) repeat protein
VAAVRPGPLPLTAREADAADAAAGFERAQARPAVRGQVHDSVLQRWPDNLVSLIGRGTARAAQGDWPGAAADFERAAQRHDSAAAWHNLALAQWQLARTDDARRSARRALERAEAADPQWREATRKLVEQLK